MLLEKNRKSDDGVMGVGDISRGTKFFSKGETNQRDKALIDRICNDEQFAYHFIHEMCRPLLSKIVWTIYNNDADYDELVNNLYLHLKKPNAAGDYWHALKSFDYRTSLFDYIKTIAVRLFYTPSENVFSIPEYLIENGVAQEMFLRVDVAICRKYLWYRYIDKLDSDSIANNLGIEKDKLTSLSRRSIKRLNRIVKNEFSDYYDDIFRVESREKVGLEVATKIVADKNSHQKSEVRIDVLSYLDRMPNEKYRMVLSLLFLEDKDYEEVAEVLNTSVSNIYNIKLRAIEQLRDLVLYFKDVDNIDYYIKKVNCDRFREILLSIFIRKEDYDTVRSRYALTETDFKKMKKSALKELKSLIFKK